MFILSQYILKNIKICNFTDITSYSIAIGLIIYTSIYLYLLFNNNELLSIFNKFIIYIISIDLLLSSFYYLNNDKQQHSENINSENIKLIEDTESYDNDTETDIDKDTETDIDNDIESYIDNDTENQSQDDFEDITEIETYNQIKDEDTEIKDEDTEIKNENNQLQNEEVSENLDTNIILQKDNSTLDLESSILPIKKKRGRKPNVLKL